MFLQPASLNAAIDLLAQNRGRLLAGGTDFFPALGQMAVRDPLIDISRLSELRTISVGAGTIRLGAACTWSEIVTAPLPSGFDALKEAAREIGSVQIQNRGTIGGNLCNASPAADSVPALVAAAAKAVIVGPKGKRTVAVEEIPVGPGKTSLKKGEIIESIVLPKRPPKSGDAYLRFIPRTEMDIAVVGVGVNVTLDGKGIVTKARVALGAVAPTVRLVPAAAKALIGTKMDKAALDAMAAACSAACSPIDDKRGTRDFRIKVAGVLARRAALIARKRAGGK